MKTALNIQIATPKSMLDLTPLAGRVGAEIRNFRISDAIDATELSALRDALYRYKVIFFRGQHHLDDTQHQAFGRLFGDLVEHPTVPSKRDGTKIHEMDSLHGTRANSWHTDMTFMVEYPQISILLALVIPEYGGDTLWSNTAAAYQELPESLKALADDLWAVHGNDYDYAATRVDDYVATPKEAVKGERKTFVSRLIESEHPLVRVHPATGERTLVSGHFSKRFVGYNTQDSNHLFAIFHNHITRPENTVRWNWSAGDVAIWDNRATQHYAASDYGDQRRIVRRVTVAGEAPVSVDGQRSRPHNPSVVS